MKKILQLTVIVLVLAALSGCSDDNGGTENPYFLKVGDERFTLNKGCYYYSYESIDSVSNELVFMLMSPDVKITPASEGDDYVTTGRGAAIVFHTFSMPNLQLEDNYVCYQSGQPSLGDFGAQYSADYDFNEDEGDIYTITSGDLSIDKAGNVFELEFDCANREGVKVSGYYKGVLMDLGDE